MLIFNIVLGYQGLLFRDFFWFFFRFFCFSIQLTDPISGNPFNGKQRQKRGWPYRYIFFSLLASFPFFLLLALSLCFTRLCGSHISSNKWLNWFTSHQLHYYIACIIRVLWANRVKCSILCKAQNERKVQDVWWRKNCSACNQSIVLALSPTYAHKYWLTLVMSKGPMKTQSITPKLLPFWLPETLTAA